ncbi:MAG: virulence RhuM family protein [Prolixibacteraceae bacterium]|nr:virulence RhuM family protein [Prolixibacteraceae bacterium]MBT6006856.1 virulence RhuM family protein [Prolixibacteraceae bacterium]MBT6763822.1 virulence RhuM family protein [Prolixibacteraceae bacterium]MBT6999522.1 virulence RhuM family protein [Prolixibacteraceae bacterium]MBT7395912.1 virulence RhuM family protein [Prolixibacteraceae bacterium]
MTNSEILLYQTEDGQTKIDVRLEEETVWLSQVQMGELFQKERSVITKHINNIFNEGELEEKLVRANFAHTTQHGAIKGKTQVKNIKLYNLDVVISVGYRVKSHQGTKFRQWATARLKEYIVKGFTMNDDLLKQAGGGNYFDELLARIRDIRSSEKVFWRKVLEIYSTSIDYDPSLEMSVMFFKTVQNKMHWAAHGKTAAEVIYQRVDSSLPNLGLSNFKGTKPTKQETEIAKNYLSESELNILNRIVTAFLEIAEIQALNQTPMYMKDWIEQLDSFLKMTKKEVLSNAGNISHQQALQKAHSEYEKYKELKQNELSEVEKHFIKQITETTKKLKNKKDK